MSLVTQPETPPLNDAQKRHCWDMARYISARLKGQPATPPADWSAAQTATCEAILTDPAECAGILNWIAQGVRAYRALSPAEQATIRADAHRYRR